MKRIWLWLLLLGSVAAEAQVVSIHVNGNRNQQLVINGITYDINNTTANNFSSSITLTNLRPGEYSMQLLRLNDDYPNDDNMPVKDNHVGRIRSISTFTVREGFDISIVIAPNGIVKVKDKQIAGTTSDQTVAMNDLAFNNLVNSINEQWRNNRRINLVRTAFSNNNNYFTTAQALQIIGMVSGDADRAALAKMAYGRLTDPANFVQVYNLMTEPGVRDDLAAFIRIPAPSNSLYSYSESFRTEMNEATLDGLMQNIKRQTDPALRANAISEIVSNTTNYFTVAQVRRLLELVTYESTRLQLLKNVFNHVIDPENYPLLYSLLNTDITKIELINFVRDAAENSGIVNYNRNKPAISDERFTSLFNSVLSLPDAATSIARITNAFADFSNYFTTVQVAQLISLVPGELNRLGLAKTAYRGVIDPENYIETISTLLETQAARNEVIIHAYSYRQ